MRSHWHTMHALMSTVHPNIIRFSALCLCISVSLYVSVSLTLSSISLFLSPSSCFSGSVSLSLARPLPLALASLVFRLSRLSLSVSPSHCFTFRVSPCQTFYFLAVSLVLCLRRDFLNNIVCDPTELQDISATK